MKRFITEQSDEELYTVHTGLALVGLCLNRFTTMDRQLARRVGRCRSISYADVLESHVELLSLGKSDYEAITDKIKDEYFKESLGIRQVGIPNVQEEQEYKGKSYRFTKVMRLPSGKFATNALIMSLVVLAYNILRYIGQMGLLGDVSP